MNSIRTSPPCHHNRIRWVCYWLDAVLVTAGAALVWWGPRPLGPGLAALVVTCVTSGALASLLPYWAEPAPQLPSAAFPKPERSLPESDPTPQLAELALLAWRIRQRAEQAPDTHRSVLRNARRLIEVLETLGVEIVSYAGRKLDPGSRVRILEAVPGEEDRVVEESEPEVQVDGRLVHQAMVTVGRGQPPRTNPRDRA